MEAAFRFGPSATEGQFQARQRRQRLPLPLLASRLAPWPLSSAHRPATLRMHLPLPSRLRCTVGARPDAQGGRALATPVLCVNQSLPRRFCWGIPAQSTGRSAFHAERRRRTTLLCAADKPPEESLKKTVEVDRLIDVLRSSNPRELDQIVVENVLSFDAGFWIRLAARIDLCKSDDDKKDYEELAENVMNIVDRLVHKTDQKIEQSTDVLKAIISPVMHEGDVQWPPRGPDTLKLMEKEIARREQEGQLDEGFLSEVSAQLRQAKQDGDKPGLQAMLQKVLQLYASKSLQKRSYAYKGEQVIVPEKFLECVIKAPENEWNKVLLDGLTVGKGDVSPDDLYAVINKRIERVLIRTEGGSYQQRILVEYLKEIQARAEEVVKVLQGPTI